VQANLHLVAPNPPGTVAVLQDNNSLRPDTQLLSSALAITGEAIYGQRPERHFAGTIIKPTVESRLEVESILKQ